MEKNILIKELDWFTFGTDLNELEYVSENQAIALILQNHADLKPLLTKYKFSIINTELYLAFDFHRRFCRTVNVEMHELQDLSEKIYFPARLPVNTAIDLLKKARLKAIYDMDVLSIFIIYSLLQQGYLYHREHCLAS